MRQPGDLGLRRRLAGRLYPMTITIGVIIALGLPLTHWTLQTRALTETAQAYARHVAARRSETGAADAAGLGRLLPGTGVTRVSVADAGGRLLARWDDASAARASWWRSGEALGVAPLPSGGHVEVTLARGPLVGVTLLLLAVGLTAGIGLALLVYRVPLGAVGGMERRIEDLIAAAEQSNLELERRATEHQSFLEANLLLASTLDLEEVLGRLTEMTRSRLDVDVVRLWFREAHSGALVLQSQAGESWSEEAQHQRLAPGEGLTGWVLSERFPLALDDAQTDPRLKNRAWFTAEGIQSFLGVPLLVNETAVGILTCLSRTRRTWGTDEVSLAQALAALAALAVRNAQYHSASVRRSEELAALLRATRSVMEGLDLRVILERIVDEAAQIADTPHVMLLLADPEAPVLRIGAVAGDPVPPRFTASTTGTLPGLVATTGRPLHVADVRRDPRNPLAERDRRLGVVSYLGLPVRIRDRVLGVLTFRSVRPREYSPDELGYLASFANQAAIAIENARLFEETQRNLRQTRALLAVAQSATATVDATEIIRCVADEARRLLGADAAVFYTFDEATGEIVPRANPELPPAIAVVDEPCTLGDVPATVAEAMLTGHAVFGLEPAAGPAPARAVLAGPVRMKDQLFGSLAVYWWRAPHESAGSELAVLEALAGEAALVLDNARLVSATQKQAVELREKNTELDSFAYVVSHDLKAPLVTIHGMSSLVLEDAGPSLSTDTRHYLERIQANVRQMERLIVDLLAVSRIGREARAPEPLVLGEVVEDVLLRLAEPIRQARVRIVRADLGAIVTAVRTQMEQVIANLVGNAIKYMGDQPAPTVTIGCADRDDGVECWVQDNGVGIDPAYHGKVFEFFQRLKDLDVEGSGLGLPIVRKIVEGAGGRVWVESARGQGSTFRFTWPNTIHRDLVRQ